MHDGALKCY